ncbi:hypothetical protein T4B_11471 [Trichinella pseudospiralis]|uniref:Uncharacterized protein n=1 Tax=Trichinella pseudospiralis TaxID=6337 RepID=A0A0V1J0H2_TRIPS|nr:hypothetical protein T4B_11471 [Trichinella pseudospiralis]KRZ38839.1 hypothetical protein T4C_1388 [Trichinella pseudospiralis]
MSGRDCGQLTCRSHAYIHTRLLCDSNILMLELKCEELFTKNCQFEIPSTSGLAIPAEASSLLIINYNISNNNNNNNNILRNILLISMKSVSQSVDDDEQSKVWLVITAIHVASKLRPAGLSLTAGGKFKKIER